MPADPGGWIENISQTFQFRYKINNAPFGDWTTWPYYPGVLPPEVVNYGMNDKVQVELRSLDWSGNTSIPLAYEISKATVTPEVGFNLPLDFDMPVSIPDAGSKIVRLITDQDIDGDGRRHSVEHTF